ncbi:PREDICTED: uncharacterized protein LOC109114282, partial [Nelumbo nucifera]|uniref:Uncharacterized protein LOC109114282 n=1 Tax=Nelumbo nucifera TaxID=4432 RepID=A0A1U8Q081_NELNU
MSTEIEALHKNNTWDIVDLPAGKEPIGCKWAFTTKYRVDGIIERYKAQLVAKGYTQNAFLNGDLTEEVYMFLPLGIYGKEMQDDIVVTSSDIEEVSALKKFLNSEFEIKYLGKLRYFLGIEVARSKE